MIEEYFIKELESVKKELEESKLKISELENARIKPIKEKAIKLSLIPINNIVEKLLENNVDIKKIVEEWSSEDVCNLIIEQKLYKKERDYIENVVMIDGKYFLEKTYYNTYRYDDACYITEKDYIYYELCDKLYDNLNQYIKNQEKQTKGE